MCNSKAYCAWVLRWDWNGCTEKGGEMNLHSFKPDKQACMILGAQKHTTIRNHNMLLVCWLCLDKFNVVWNEALVELNVAGTRPAAYSLEKSMSASSTYSHTRAIIPKDTKTFWESIEKFLKGLLENMITTFQKSTFNYQYLGRHDFNPRLPSGGWITFSSGGCARVLWTCLLLRTG